VSVAVDPYDPESFRRDGYEVIDVLADYLAGTANREGPVLDFVSPAELLEQWPADFSIEQTVRLPDLTRRVIRESHHIHHPRYVGHQVSAPLPTAALAELVGAVLNNGMAEYEMGPVANVMEQRVIEWLGTALGFDDPVGGMLTSGGSVANLTALAAARQSVAGTDIWRDGVTGAEPLGILVSGQAHYSIDRAARILGLGAAGVIAVATDDQMRLDPARIADAEREAERRGRRVFAIVGSACTTSTGAFDPLDAIADYADAHGLWFHVDGAHGAVAALSPRYRHLVNGIERADSVIIDAHKMLQMPALITAVLFKRRETASLAFHQDQSYINFREEVGEYPWWDSGLRTLECTKRMMSLEIYAAVREHGTDRFRVHVESTFDLARRFAKMIDDEPDFECPVEPQANIVCFRYAPASIRDLDELQLRVRTALLASGDFYIVKTRLRGGIYLRITVINARTTDEDLRNLLAAVKAAAASTTASPH